MPVISAVAHLPLEPEGQRAALSAMGGIPGLSLGVQVEDRLPVVLESDTRDQDRQRWRQLQDVAGLRHIELVFADFADLTDPSAEDLP